MKKKTKKQLEAELKELKDRVQDMENSWYSPETHDDLVADAIVSHEQSRIEDLRREGAEWHRQRFFLINGAA